METTNLRVMGFTCGAGSMLIGARAAGFNVVGNIEWRKYYHSGTFETNFKDAFMVHHTDELSYEQRMGLVGIDLLMGHPECGNYSVLKTDKNRKAALNDAGDIPLFIKGVQEFKPRFFVMDNLPKSLMAFTAEQYAAELPDYDLFFEWISNYNYGNPQINRRRLFVIGARKEEKFVFVPGEIKCAVTVKERIGDLMDATDGSIPNHNRVNPEEIAYLSSVDKMPFKDLAKKFLALNEGRNISYVNRKGETHPKPGFFRGHWDGPAHVMTGAGYVLLYNQYHSLTGYPLTIRERARIQGCPDSFVFKGTDREMVLQTGKFMPVEFCTYVAEQIRAHIEFDYGWIVNQSNQREVKENPLITDAKRWYCRNVGYADQKRACSCCWAGEGCECLLMKRSTEVPS